jgi:hypothetical protein
MNHMKERKLRLNIRPKHFSDNNSDNSNNSGRYANWIAIRFSIFCDQDDT